VTALDASADALALARENAAASGLRIELIAGDAFAGLPPGPFDLVVSNPPYVHADELASLEPEVRDFEPRAALVDGGHTEAIAQHARHVLRGAIVLETHAEGAGAAAELLRSLGYEDVSVSRDLSERERIVEGRWTP
jgi:release factor glutamine methyltransferase